MASIKPARTAVRGTPVWWVLPVRKVQSARKAPKVQLEPQARLAQASPALLANRVRPAPSVFRVKPEQGALPEQLPEELLA